MDTCSSTCQANTSAVAYSWDDVLFEKMQWISSVVFYSPSDQEDIQLDVFGLDRFGEDQPFEEAQEGRHIKGLPACSDGYAARPHEHVTDEQRRHGTIWSYITVLSSRNNNVDIQKTTENTEMTLHLFVWSTPLYLIVGNNYFQVAMRV